MSGAEHEPSGDVPSVGGEDERDAYAISAQLGRPTRGGGDVVARCDLGLPVVVRMPPVLPGGEPFPTRYWLTCPLLHRRVARLEAAGGVGEMERAIDADPALRDAVAAAHARYAEERDAALTEDVAHPPRGGVAGIVAPPDARPGVKCLHAHLADFVAGNANPIGRRVAPDALPAACPSPCVRPRPEDARGRWERDPDWREPSI